MGIQHDSNAPTQHYTPLKINMEHNNEGVWKMILIDFPLQIGDFQ